jgi:hypothetical protein
VLECTEVKNVNTMPVRTPDQRAEVLRKIDEKLSANTYLLSFEQAFETLKEIEAEMLAAEDDSALYSALFKVREELKHLMDGRALELGKSEDWAEVVKWHDTKLMLRPLFRAAEEQKTVAAPRYNDAFRALSPEQRAALAYWEKKTGSRLPRPEVLEAELRWNEVRLRSILRFVPDLRFRRWSERVKAILFIGLFFAIGLVVAIGNNSWVATLVLLALVAIVLATWVRDFICIRRNPPSVKSKS